MTNVPVREKRRGVKKDTNRLNTPREGRLQPKCGVASAIKFLVIIQK